MQQYMERAVYKNTNQLKICTWGTFDCLHDGHKEFLRKVSLLGELYVIIVPSHIKFENSGYYPLKDEKERKTDLLHFGKGESENLIADIIIDCFEDGMHSLLQIQPDFFAFGYDQNGPYDKQLIEFARIHNLSTTFIRMVSAHGNGVHSSHINIVPPNRFPQFDLTLAEEVV